MIDLKKPELLAPAGNMEKLKMAFIYGADAAYLAGKTFGMRAQSGNFTNQELIEAVLLAHSLNKKVYITVNIMPHNEELEQLPEYLSFLQSINVDGLIISDMGVLSLAKQYAPKVDLHISTQANTVNWAGALMYEQLGAKRIVLARELSLDEITKIRSKCCSIQLETFVHGAMCISYSGRCLLSSYMSYRDANQGFCSQSCRWRYSLVEEKRPGEYYPIEQDEHGTYVFNSRDLRLLEYLPELIEANVDSFKIEGRMKSVHYVATVVSVYRQAIDSYFADKEKFQIKKEWLGELEKISHRPYTNGFIKQKPDKDGQIYTTSSYEQTHDFVGLVTGYQDGKLILEQRNNIQKDQILEIIAPDGQLFEVSTSVMFDADDNPIDEAPHPRQVFKIPYDKNILPNSMLRRKVNGG